MIIKAEQMSSSEQITSYHKKYDKNKDLHRSLERKNHSRSRSRSKEQATKCTSDYKFQHNTSQQKQISQRHKVSDYYQEAAHGSSSNQIKNWKKIKDNEKTPDSSQLKETNLENINTNVVDNKDLLTEAEMNKLAAKIIKAELMGDDVWNCFFL